MRKIINEAKIVELVKSHGFQVVFCEDLSYSQQVQLFAEAELVVGMHGAGLVNQIYMSEGRKVSGAQAPKF